MLLNRPYNLQTKICIKYSKHEPYSFSYTIVSLSYRNSNFVLVLSMKKHPQEQDTLSKLQKFSAQPKTTRSARTVENSHSFSMFPILDTNLYLHRMWNNLPFQPQHTYCSSFSLCIQIVLFRFCLEVRLEISFEIEPQNLRNNLFG